MWRSPLVTLVASLAGIAFASEGSNYFTAGVYEHIVSRNRPNMSRAELLVDNLAVYAQVCERAAQAGVDILVLPEYGTIDFHKIAPEDFGLFHPVPDPSSAEVNPCIEGAQGVTYANLVLRNLSCMARKNKLYIVVNILSTTPCGVASDSLCPQRGFYLYNTNVVFDRDGRLIARYYKHNLYAEVGLNVPRRTTVSYFDTEFGRFGTFVCFDAMFKEAVELVERYNVTTVVYPTFWLDHLPFSSALQIQASWAYRFDVNFMAANVQYPPMGALGSGIYNGRRGMLVGTNTPDGVPRLLVARLPKNPKDRIEDGTQPTVIEIELDPRTRENLNVTYKYFSLAMNDLTAVPLTENSASLQACHTTLCCQFDYESPDLQPGFVLGVSKGVINRDGQFSMAFELCGLFICGDQQCKKYATRGNSRFTHLRISANFSSEYVYPSVTGSSLTPIATSLWNYTQSDNTISYSNPDVDTEVIGVSMFARLYDKDPQATVFQTSYYEMYY